MSANEHDSSDLDKNLVTFPVELLLEVVRYVPYSPRNLSSLRRTCRKFNALIKEHEKSLVVGIWGQQYLPASLSLFPGIKISNFANLNIVHERLEALEHLHSQWLRITNNSPELDWLTGRWEAIHKAGLLLLYRLKDAGSHDNKLALLKELPTTSLACLLFKLNSSIRILRIYGPNPINGSFASGDIMARSDIELAFEEMLLQHGPDFFITMLKAGPDAARSTWATSALETEVAGMIDRQSFSESGLPKPPTLTSSMRRAFVAQVECHISQNVGKMWEVLSSTKFDTVDEAKMAMLVRGKEIKGGSKRMGY